MNVRTLLDGQKRKVSKYKEQVAASALCILLLLCLQGSGQLAFSRMGQHTSKNGGHTSARPMGQSMARQSMARSIDPPIRLIISAIHLDAAVETVGLNANGDLDTPQEYPLDDVGWYGMGPEPGARGSAVIDGHLDRPGGSPAVFWYLSSLQVGDDVMVLTSRGRTLHFLVTHVQAYQPQNAPLQAIFGDMSGSYLNLITCTGDWIPAQHQTTQRLVVYTSLS